MDRHHRHRRIPVLAHWAAGLELLSEYEEFPGVAANWALYGSSGHVSKPPGLVTENYLWRADSRTSSAPGITSPSSTPSGRSRPSPRTTTGTRGGAVDEEKRPVEWFSDGTLLSKIRVNHYYTRSEEECARKYARPRVNDSLQMRGGVAPLEELHLSLHDKRDDSILIYVPAVREALEKVNERAPFEPEPFLPATAGASSGEVAEGDGAGATRDSEWGPAALRCIEAAVESARRLLPPNAVKRSWVDRILVFPCGRGSVVRVLRTAFPDAQITACDLDPDAVAFCAQAYGAVPLHAHEDPARIETDATFDLIWCGSLFTHLDSGRWLPFLEFLEGRLRPWGILLFATNGQQLAPALGPPDMEAGRAEEMRAEFAQTGFSHGNGGLAHWYDPDGRGLSEWGTAIASPAWVCRRLEARPGLRLLTCAQRGWNQQQDVVACARAGPWAVVRDLVQAQASITEQELVALTGYPDATIRRQLERLSAQGPG